MNKNTADSLIQSTDIFSGQFARKLLVAGLLAAMMGCSSGGGNSNGDDSYGGGTDSVADGSDQTDGSQDNGDSQDSGAGQDDSAGQDSGNANSPVVSAFVPGSTSDLSLGTVMVSTDGLTLYVFENDRNDTDGDGVGDSDCNGNCASNWPPVEANPDDSPQGKFTVITRDDGSTLQWAYNDMPLYFFAGDSEAGETNGEGINNVWFVARPDPFTTAETSLGSVIAGSGSVTTVEADGSQSSARSDKSGFSLYAFDNDVTDADGDGGGDSDCNGSCAVNWPPLYADNAATAAGNYTIIDRDDGSRQWAFKGEPLYFFAGDTSAGDTNGEGAGGVWHLARKAPVQLFDSGSAGDVFAARGLIADVDGSGNQAATSTDKTGFTVYLFDDDTNDVDGDGADSDCNGGCASTWPPLYANDNDSAAGDFTIIDREDGSRQWVYKNAPLYFFVGDQAPGGLNGVYGTWHEVTP